MGIAIGYLMAGVFIIALVGFVRMSVGKWKHSILVIVSALLVTAWIVVAGLLIRGDLSKETVSIMEAKRVSDQLCDTLIEVYGKDALSKEEELKLRNESLVSLINILESKGYTVE